MSPIINKLVMAKDDIREYVLAFNPFFYVFFPFYALHNGILHLYEESVRISVCKNLNWDCVKSKFDHKLGEWETFYEKYCEQNICLVDKSCCDFKTTRFLDFKLPGIGLIILFLLLFATAYYFILLCIAESSVCNNLSCRKKLYKDPVGEDADVYFEKQRIRSYLLHEIKFCGNLTIYNLTKWHQRKRVVNGLCLQAQEKECIGILGANGSGLTSIIRMLSREKRISFGTAYISGYNLRNRLWVVSNLYGYAPKSKAVSFRYTMLQILTIILMIRGYRKSDSIKFAKALAEKFKYTEYLNFQTQHLSLGTMKIFCNSLAFVDNFPVLLFNRPSAGLDLQAREHMWEIMLYATKLGKTVFFSSYSAEEAQLICTKVGVMTKGSLRCWGTIQDVIEKHLPGIYLALDLETHNGRIDDYAFYLIDSHIKNSFRNAELKQENYNRLLYYINLPVLYWPEIFRILDRAASLPVTSFAIIEPNFEHLFLDIIKRF